MTIDDDRCKFTFGDGTICGMPALEHDPSYVRHKFLKAGVTVILEELDEKQKPAQSSDLREQLAALCHEQWSGWMVYLFEKSPMGAIPDFWVSRWKRQMNTSYAELSEEEKELDRREADRFLRLLSAHVASR